MTTNTEPFDPRKHITPEQYKEIVHRVNKFRDEGNITARQAEIMKIGWKAGIWKAAKIEPAPLP